MLKLYHVLMAIKTFQNFCFFLDAFHRALISSVNDLINLMWITVTFSATGSPDYLSMAETTKPKDPHPKGFI